MHARVPPFWVRVSTGAHGRVAGGAPLVRIGLIGLHAERRLRCARVRGRRRRGRRDGERDEEGERQHELQHREGAASLLRESPEGVVAAACAEGEREDLLEAERRPLRVCGGLPTLPAAAATAAAAAVGAATAPAVVVVVLVAVRVVPGPFGRVGQEGVGRVHLFEAHLRLLPLLVTRGDELVGMQPEGEFAEGVFDVVFAGVIGQLQDLVGSRPLAHDASRRRWPGGSIVAVPRRHTGKREAWRGSREQGQQRKGGREGSET